MFDTNEPMNDTGQGSKHDEGKRQLHLLPGRPLEEITKVLEHGAKTYGPNNWRLGFKWSRLYDACMRHLLAWNERETYDHDSELNHLAHAACCLIFLLELDKTHPDLDDRMEMKDD